MMAARPFTPSKSAMAWRVVLVSSGGVSVIHSLVSVAHIFALRHLIALMLAEVISRYTISVKINQRGIGIDAKETM